MKQKKDTSEIFDAALRVFARFGYKKTTLDDIAAELSMTKSNIYLYAKNKEHLYEEAVRHGLLKWQGKVVSEINGIDDAVEQFRVLCGSAYRYLAHDEHLRTVLLNDPAIFPISPAEDRFSDINNASINMLKNIITRGMKEKKFRKVNVDHAAEFIFSVYVMFIVKTYVKKEGRSIEELFDDAVDMVLNGLLIHK